VPDKVRGSRRDPAPPHSRRHEMTSFKHRQRRKRAKLNSRKKKEKEKARAKAVRGRR